jgi:peptide/nickel transport system permease protein
VVVATVVSLSLLIEAALSFLGIGMAVGEISWGVLLNQGKLNIAAYWLSLFPGILLVITVYSLNTIAKEGKRRN